MVVQDDLETDLVSSTLKNDKKHRLKQRFDVQRKLGQGTYGKVQLAVNRETGQEVAVKTIKKVKIENEKDLIRIRREIQIMSSIQHPHIIHIYEVFENKDKIVLVMQFASGGELYDYLSEKKVLSDIEARRIFRQIAAAVYYCHKNKICHRDLKLENILLDEKGNAKIADFGLSNVFDEKHLLNTYCGSPLYASPEIVKGVPYYGPEVDCWSMGVLLYTLVYGAMPFDGSNFKKLVTQISEGDYFEPKIKSNASELIRKLLTVNPNKRATIVDICMDYWVNLGYEHSLLQVAEDMANLTPVRLDLLLALAPSDIPQEELEQLEDDVGLLSKDLEKDIPDEEEEDEDYNPDTAANSFSFMKGSHASQLSISQPNLQEALADEYEEGESDNDFLPADLAVALQGECAKRLAERSFGSSLARISSLAHRNKKTKKSDSLTVVENKNKMDEEKFESKESEKLDVLPSTKKSSSNIACKEENEKVEKSKISEQVNKTPTAETSNDNIPSKNLVASKSVEVIPQGDVKNVVDKKNISNDKSESSALQKDPSVESKQEIKNINQRKESISAPEEKTENKKMGRPPGKIMIPKTFDSPQSTPSPKSSLPKQITKTESKIENREQPQSTAAENEKNKLLEYKPATEDINKNLITNTDPKSETISNLAITEEKKNIAKGILKKGIAKAKLAERRMSKQSSLDSEVSSTCSTPVSSIATPEVMPSFYKTPKPYVKEENTNMISKAEINLNSAQTSSSTLKSDAQKAPLWDNAGRISERGLPDKNVNWSTISSTIDSEMSGWREQMEESLRRLSPDDERLSKDSFTLSNLEEDKPLVPIARSYKKFTFTKDGACITETKKIYTTPGADGSWTKVEKKTKITTRPGNAEEFEKFRDLHLRNTSPLNRSDSQSSSGSNDVYDDIFDSWTGDTMMCNMRKMNSMFQKFSRDPFLRKERRRNPFRFFRRTDSEMSERERKKYETHAGRSTDREASETEEDYDVHFDDSSAVVYGSQGLWQLLRSANRGLPGRITIHHEPISYGRSVSQDRSESKIESNWKRCNSRTSSGYNTSTRSQSRDRTESPREKVLRFVFESPRESLSRDSSIRNEKFGIKRNVSHRNPRRDSGVGSDGYESEYSVRQSPSDEFSHTGRVSSMSSICSAAKQDMLKNFMKSWSKEFMSPTSIGSKKEQFENLPDSRKHRVEQWLQMNSESPYDFYSDNHSGMSSRKSSASHGSSAYATMRPREYLRYNRSSSDKTADSDTTYFSSFDDSPRIRSHSLNKDSSFGEANKIRLRTAAYSPVSEESSKGTSIHHSDSSHSASSVHRINFTFSDGRVGSSQVTPPTSSRHIRHISGPKDGSITIESPPPANVKFEQVSSRSPGQPVVQMRVSINRGNRENQVIHVTSHSPQNSKGLWEQQESDKRNSPSCRSSKAEFSPPVARVPSPVPGIRQFSTEVQHSVGCSESIPRASVECEIVNSEKENPSNAQTGKNMLYKNNHLSLDRGIWDMACSQTCMENEPELVNINLNAQHKMKIDNFSFTPNNPVNSSKVANNLKNEYDENDSSNYESQSISNGANTPDSLEDLSIEQSLSEFPANAASNVIGTDICNMSPNTRERNEFHLEVKPLGTLWSNCDGQVNSKYTEKKNNFSSFAQGQNISPVSSISTISEVPDFQKKCLENTNSEIGSIWNQKNASQTFDLLKNLLSNDGLDSFSSAKCVLTSNYKTSENSPQNCLPVTDSSIGHQSLSPKHITVIDGSQIEQITNDKFHKMMPSLMDDLQSPKEVLRQAMKICKSLNN